VCARHGAQRRDGRYLFEERTHLINWDVQAEGMTERSTAPTTCPGSFPHIPWAASEAPDVAHVDALRKLIAGETDEVVRGQYEWALLDVESRDHPVSLPRGPPIGTDDFISYSI